MNIGKLLGQALKAAKTAAPAIVTAVVVHQVTTGKLDVKGALLDTLADALAKRRA